MSLINDILSPLMTDSINRNVQYSFTNLDMVRDEVLDNINGTIAGTTGANLTEEMIRYFIKGISAFYVNFTFQVGVAGQVNTLSADEHTCANNAIYQHLFPLEEQVKIASLGNNLQQIAVAYEVARAVSATFCQYVHRYAYASEHIHAKQLLKQEHTS